MTLENQVCSRELAQKLKELGVEQESLFWWNFDKKQNGNWGEPNDAKYLHLWDITYSAGLMDIEAEVKLSAFTVAELGEMLPRQIERFEGRQKCERVYTLGFITTKPRPSWGIEYLRDDGGSITQGDYDQNALAEGSEADARAKMLIYLLEQKLITL